MKSRDICPTCGTALGPLHDKDALRRCTSCARVNPRGFYYCGYCAAPMESTAHRAELADIAAPAGGWPSLARELIEVRFFMDRGELDDAFELLAVLRERHPGHPELDEFRRSPAGARPRPDTQVNRVVDSVLSGSSSLSDAMPRRSAPQWNAPVAQSTAGDGGTRAHEAVPVEREGERPAGRKRVVSVGGPRRAGSFPAVGEGEGEAEPRPTNTDVRAVVPPAVRPADGRARVKTDQHVGVARPSRRAALDSALRAHQRQAHGRDAEASAADGVDPRGAGVSPPPVAGQVTVAVPTLQPAAPFGGVEAVPGSAVRKRALKARKRSGAEAPIEGSPEPSPARRKRGLRFGQHVLGRLGGKDGKPEATS